MIIGICGGTGSGKTTIARRIFEVVGTEHVILLEQDSYYRNLADMPLDARHKANFDHPDSIDSEMLMNHLKRLKSNLPIDMPIYDFRTHTRSERVEHLDPKPVVLVEGILIFAEPRILNLLDIKVFVDTPDDIRFIRRLQRDIRERGRTAESVIEQYLATVRPMHFEFVEPSKRHADLIVPEGATNEISIEILCGMILQKVNPEQK
jgi:uridine kinase